MPIELSVTGDGTIALAHCFGTLTETDCLEAVRFAFATQHMQPGRDRIVTIEKGAQLHKLDFDVLKSIQECVLEEETRGGGTPRFRSVLVFKSPPQENILKLYQAIWQDLHLPDVEYFVTDNEDVALKILTDTRGSERIRRRA